MHPTHTPLTVEGALLSAPDRAVLRDAELKALAGTFPSTAHLGDQPWNPEAIQAEALRLWSAVSESVDPVFSECAEQDFLSTLPATMQTLSTLRFLLWLWRPGARTTNLGTFDLGNTFLCHWDEAHRAAFLRWAQTGTAGPTTPSEIFRVGDRAAHPHAGWPDAP
jgi:hypothetical protein